MVDAGLRAMAGALAAVVAPALARRGRGLAVILAEWPRIVGEELAEAAVPLRFGVPPRGGEGATLVVQVSGAAATELLHRAPEVVARINGFLGHRAVERLRLVHGLARRIKALPPALPKLDPQAEQALAAGLAGVESPELKAALARFGGTLTALAKRAGRHV